MTTLCKTFVPEDILSKLETIKDDEMKVKEYGIELATSMCVELIESGKVESLHLYTMNNEDNIREIVKRLAPYLPDTHREWISQYCKYLLVVLSQVIAKNSSNYNTVETIIN